MHIERIAYRKKMLMSRIRSGSGESSGVVKLKKKYKIRVMSNVATPWYGREALTINIGLDHNK